MFNKKNKQIMKRNVFFLAFVLVASIAFGQFSIGAKGGLNFSKLPENVQGGTAGEIVTALDEVYTGYHFGAIVYFGFSSGYVQAELLYSQTGQDMQIDLGTTENFESKFRTIDIPINAGIRFGPIKLGAGPVFSYLIKNDDTLGPDIDFGQKLKELTLGYQIGTGLKLGKLIIDLKYQGNLTKYGEEITFGGQTFEFDRRPHNFILSLGLLL
jgi:hypothetical protein